MKEALFLLSAIFVILPFLGAGYVLVHDGQVSAGYAVVPMVLSLALIAAYRKKRNL
jgi:hypothetical protein